MTRLHIELSAPTRPHNAVWSFGGSVGNASLLLRKDVRRHLLICRDELGFRHVACQGILGDAMNILREDGSFSFDKVESSLDWLLENGMVPFLRLSPISASPGAAARWPEAVTALVTHIDGRYGCDAREWHFEIDGTGPADSSAAGQDDQSSFGAVARAIKQVHPEYRVGLRAGPIERFDQFLSQIGTPPGSDQPDAAPCDFVTLDGGAALRPVDARQKLTAKLGEATPLFVMGWGASASAQTASAHDECAWAAFVTQSAVELSQTCQGILCDAVSDIPGGVSPLTANCEPFHGGSGLITVNDVRKSAFHALRLLNEHGGYHGERLETRWEGAPAGLGCLATRSEHTLRLLLWLHREAGAPATEGLARFTIEGVPDAVTEAQVEVIRSGAGSAYEAWVLVDKPEFINREVLDALEVASLTAQATVNFREYPPRLEPGMVMQLTMHLPWD